jgi:tRNA dimethylallyltransferase
MQKLLVITGPTASGKTTLALEIAKEFGGEVICADSRTIYKGMDIGTARLSLQKWLGLRILGWI